MIALLNNEQNSNYYYCLGRNHKAFTAAAALKTINNIDSFDPRYLNGDIPDTYIDNVVAKLVLQIEKDNCELIVEYEDNGSPVMLAVVKIINKDGIVNSIDIKEFNCIADDMFGTIAMRQVYLDRMVNIIKEAYKPLVSNGIKVRAKSITKYTK